MSKVVKIMKNKLMIAAMVVVMVFGTAMVPVHAAAVETNYYGEVQLIHIIFENREVPLNWGICV